MCITMCPHWWSSDGKGHFNLDGWSGGAGDNVCDGGHMSLLVGVGSDCTGSVWVVGQLVDVWHDVVWTSSTSLAGARFHTAWRPCSHLTVLCDAYNLNTGCMCLVEVLAHLRGG